MNPLRIRKMAWFAIVFIQGIATAADKIPSRACPRILSPLSNFTFERLGESNTLDVLAPELIYPLVAQFLANDQVPEGIHSELIDSAQVKKSRISFVISDLHSEIAKLKRSLAQIFPTNQLTLVDWADRNPQVWRNKSARDWQAFLTPSENIDHVSPLRHTIIFLSTNDLSVLLRDYASRSREFPQLVLLDLPKSLNAVVEIRDQASKNPWFHTLLRSWANIAPQLAILKYRKNVNGEPTENAIASSEEVSFTAQKLIAKPSKKNVPTQVELKFIQQFESWLLKVPPAILVKKLQSTDEWFQTRFKDLKLTHSSESKDPWWSYFSPEAKIRLNQVLGDELPESVRKVLKRAENDFSDSRETLSWTPFGEFADWVLVLTPNELHLRILSQKDWFLLWFRNLRSRYEVDVSKYEYSWHDFFDDMVLKKIYDTGKVTLPPHIVLRLITRFGQKAGSQSSQLYPPTESQAVETAKLKSHWIINAQFQEWLANSPVHQIQSELAQPKLATTVWFIDLQKRYPATELDNTENPRAVSLAWYHFMSTNSLRIIKDIPEFKLPKSVVSQIRPEPSTLKTPPKVDKIKVNYFAKWVLSTSDHVLREKILRVDNDFKFWFVTFRRTYPDNEDPQKPAWWTYFNDQVLEKIARTRRVYLPESVLAKFQIDEYLPERNGGPRIELDKVYKFQKWVMIMPDDLLKEKILSFETPLKTWFSGFRHTHPGSHINGRPGWWTYFSNDCLVKMYKTGKLELPQQVLADLGILN